MPAQVRLSNEVRRVAPEQDLRRSYRIAVIEEDPLMRELADRWLSDAGHEVALTSAQQVGSLAGLDLMMVDVGDLRGAAARVQLLRAVQRAPILLVSGRLRISESPQRALAHQFGVDAILPKPYAREQLLAAVAAALGIGG